MRMKRFGNKSNYHLHISKHNACACEGRDFLLG
uniref:Endoplasmic reticulum-Golgi intermediate compartment protein 3-like n=1 Tax=Rhizophora mucronata TaxID=61149 RepID=A0A2P2K274_RHIMU